MVWRVGINGFGRIGRQCLRDAWDWPDIDVVHINEPMAPAEVSAQLLEFDSVQGRWPTAISGDGKRLDVDGQAIRYSRESKPTAVDWGKSAVDIVIESSGKFREREFLGTYLQGRLRRVVVAAPVKGVPNIVMGINQQTLDGREAPVVTGASCTTNCIAPVISVVHQAFGIRHGLITTIHNATNSQVITDRPHKDVRRARSALLSLIPTSTGSARAIGEIFPDLAGRLDGIAVRVPVLNASLVDCVFETRHPTSAGAVNGALKKAAAGPLAGILGVEERSLVSVDFAGDTRSAIVDGAATMVNDGTQLKVLAWYDGEAGYARRLMELVRYVARALPPP